MCTDNGFITAYKRKLLEKILNLVNSFTQGAHSSFLLRTELVNNTWIGTAASGLEGLLEELLKM